MSKPSTLSLEITSDGQFLYDNYFNFVPSVVPGLEDIVRNIILGEKLMSADIYPTKHVREQMEARDVTWGEIVDIVEHPEVVYGPDPKGRKIVQKGDLSIVLAPDGAIVTVLLREETAWDNEQARARGGNLTEREQEARARGGYERPDKR